MVATDAAIAATRTAGQRGTAVESRGNGEVSLAVLDFLRGVAAFMVVLNHARGTWQIGGREILRSGNLGIGDYAGLAFIQLTSFGKEFVVLFFVLSGYAMANSLRFGQRTGAFYLKRAVRIWPPYIAAVLLIMALSAAVGHPNIVTAGEFVAALFYMQHLSFAPQFWSLPHEVVFYLLCPFILFSRRSAVIIFAVAAAFLATTVLTAGPMLNPHGIFPLDFLGNELFFFASGAMAYHYIAYVPRLSGRMLVAGLSLLLAATWALKIFFGDANTPANLLVIVASILTIRNLPERLARTPLNFGYCSYSVYLFHYAFIPVATMLTIRHFGFDPTRTKSYVLWLALVPLTVLPSLALYYVTERPTNRLLARIRGRERRHAAAG